MKLALVVALLLPMYGCVTQPTSIPAHPPVKPTDGRWSEYVLEIMVTCGEIAMEMTTDEKVADQLYMLCLEKSGAML